MIMEGRENDLGVGEGEGEGILDSALLRLQKALVLDQDCTVLADQEVRLENRITLE